MERRRAAILRARDALRDERRSSVNRRASTVQTDRDASGFARDELHYVAVDSFKQSNAAIALDRKHRVNLEIRAKPTAPNTTSPDARRMGAICNYDQTGLDDRVRSTSYSANLSGGWHRTRGSVADMKVQERTRGQTTCP